MDLNKVQIIGRLTQDPEVRQTPNGRSVCSFGVATNRRWKDASTGEQREEVEFHNVVLWGKSAEIAGNYLRKGRRAYFEGRLQTRSWEDTNGVKKYKTEIIGENMIMLDGRGEGDMDTTPAAAGNMVQDDNRGSQPAPVMKDEEPAPKKQEDISIEDVPF